MNIGIIGLGLIGGSFAEAIIKKTKNKVFGFDTNADILQKANLLGIVKDTLNLKNAKTLDFLIYAGYPAFFEKSVTRFLNVLKPNAVVMDACGTKQNIVNIMLKLEIAFPSLHFISTHPMAGLEVSGLKYATPTLFENTKVLFVPVTSNLDVINNTKKFFLTLGFAKVAFTTAALHDKKIAFTSHMPHIISNAFIKSPTATEHYWFCGGSYRDLTRVAKLNPNLWAEIMLENKQNLIEEINIFTENLTLYKQALTENNFEQLLGLLKAGTDTKCKIDLNAPENN